MPVGGSTNQRLYLTVGGLLDGEYLIERAKSSDCIINIQQVDNYFNKYAFEMNGTFINYTNEATDNNTSLNLLNTFECSLFEEMPMQIYYNEHDEYFLETAERTYYLRNY